MICAMKRRIGSWLRYTDPVSIAGMLTMVVGNAPMWFLKKVNPENWRSICARSASTMSSKVSDWKPSSTK